MKHQRKELSLLEERDQSINSEELESTGIRNIQTGKLREFIQIPSYFIDTTLPRKVLPSDNSFSQISKRQVLELFRCN